jgi:hypothetical protein
MLSPESCLVIVLCCYELGFNIRKFSESFVPKKLVEPFGRGNRMPKDRSRNGGGG